MASAVNGTESEVAFVRLPVSGDLSFNDVLLPLAGLVPAEGSDPVLGADGGHGTIGVTRVVEHLNLASEGLVDPLGSLGLRDVSDLLGAKVPSLNVGWDVHSGTDGVGVHVVEKSCSEGARRKFLESLSSVSRLVTSPWSVLSGGGELLVHMGFRSSIVKVSEVSFHGLLSLRVGSSTPACAEDVVDVDFSDERVELHVEIHACLIDTDHVWHFPVTVERNEFVVHLLVHKGVPVGHVDESSCSIVLPVGDTVSDGETLKVWLECVRVVLLSLLVVLVDVISEVRNVDSGVRLTRDEKLVVLELGEFVVPLENGGQVVLSTDVIIEGAILDATAVRVTDTSGLLDVEHVSLSVPGVITLVELLATGLELEGTVLLHETKHGRAAGAAIEPDEDWGVLSVLLGLEEEVMDFLGGVDDVEVTGEGTVLVEFAHLGEFEDTVLFRLGLNGSDGSSQKSGGEFHLYFVY